MGTKKGVNARALRRAARLVAGLELISALGLLGVAPGCAGTREVEAQRPPVLPDDATALPKKQNLGDGDVVEIKVFREPELAGVYRVSRDEIEFPLIGRVALTGKEANAVAEEIRARLADGFLKQPQVTVFVREHNSRKVHVLGQVNRPGSFPYEAGMTVIQAVTNAGGFGELASSNKVLVTRVVDGAEQKFMVPVGDIGRGNAPNFQLEPGDIVFVPEAIF